MLSKKIIEVDIGEIGKEIQLDGKLIGSSGQAYNLTSLIQHYDLEGNQLLSTKSVVVNIDGFMNSIKKQYCLEKSDLTKIHSLFEKNMNTESEGYVAIFWDKTKEVHHRDIMRYVFKEFDNSVQDYIKELNLTRANTENGLNKKCDKMSNLENLSYDLQYSIQELYELKKSRSHCLGVSDISMKMLEFSQGYQITANDTESNSICRLWLDSSITDDQFKLGVYVDPKETESNINYLLSCFEDVEIKTKYFEMPDSHKIHSAELKANSSRKHGKDKFIRSEKTLKVIYNRTTN